MIENSVIEKINKKIERLHYTTDTKDQQTERIIYILQDMSALLEDLVSKINSIEASK